MISLSWSIEVCLGFDAESALVIEVAQEVEALHLGITIGADNVSHHVLDVFGWDRAKDRELCSEVFA